ncbi:hypothetical protein [Apis mellifera associated microvirus 30]|nr:hypothetical protein [Apis mellifera associated microvirus 30]
MTRAKALNLARYCKRKPMKLLMFSTYDSKVKAWNTPFFLPETISIEREWAAACNNPESKYNQHAEDYTLFEIGSYEVKTGKITAHDAPISIGTAIHFKDNK